MFHNYYLPSCAFNIWMYSASLHSNNMKLWDTIHYEVSYDIKKHKSSARYLWYEVFSCLAKENVNMGSVSWMMAHNWKYTFIYLSSCVYEDINTPATLMYFKMCSFVDWQCHSVMILSPQRCILRYMKCSISNVYNVNS